MDQGLKDTERTGKLIEWPGAVAGWQTLLCGDVGGGGVYRRSAGTMSDDMAAR